jgi:hypothetical protein
MHSLDTASQWIEVIGGALSIASVLFALLLLHRLRPGRGLPAHFVWMNITLLAAGLGLWFSVASNISGSQLLWYPAMLSFLVVVCGAIIALMLMVRQAQ